MSSGIQPGIYPGQTGYLVSSKKSILGFGRIYGILDFWRRISGIRPVNCPGIRYPTGYLSGTNRVSGIRQEIGYVIWPDNRHTGKLRKDISPVICPGTRYPTGYLSGTTRISVIQQEIDFSIRPDIRHTGFLKTDIRHPAGYLSRYPVSNRKSAKIPVSGLLFG